LFCFGYLKRERERDKFKRDNKKCKEAFERERELCARLQFSWLFFVFLCDTPNKQTTTTTTTSLQHYQQFKEQLIIIKEKK
jgi:hypothetical protein